MDTQSSPFIEELYRTLLEMAAGRFSEYAHYRKDDAETGSLIGLLALLSQAMREELVQRGFGFPNSGSLQLVQHTLLLDETFALESFTADFPHALGTPAEGLKGKPFDSFMAPATQWAWRLHSYAIERTPHYHRTLQLNFLKGESPLPMFCTLSKLLHSRYLVVSAVSLVSPTTSQFNPVLLATKREKPQPKPQDEALLGKVHAYILDHLESPLPSIRELSRQFGTNERKLKEGFRHFFHNSIYQFYQEERLKRAHLLIQRREMPLAEIAELCGFSNYPSFCRAFRKHFGFAPSHLLRMRHD